MSTENKIAELKANLTIAARLFGLSEMDTIARCQAAAAKIGDNATLEALCAIKSEMIEADPSLPINSPAVYHGYTYEQLSTAFDAVKDPNDWRAPIAAFVTGDRVAITIAAIQYFTATDPIAVYSNDRGDFAIAADGYRRGPAGDH